MEKELIIQRERENDGSSVFLYYDKEAGLYQGFGLSAYYVTAALDPMALYCEAMEMPVVMLGQRDVQLLLQRMKAVEHVPHEYYRLQMRNKIGHRWYKTWVEVLRHYKLS